MFFLVRNVFHSIFEAFQEEKREHEKIDFQVVLGEFLIALQFQLKKAVLEALEKPGKRNYHRQKLFLSHKWHHV
jgi:hypothetical protein